MGLRAKILFCMLESKSMFCAKALGYVVNFSWSPVSIVSTLLGGPLVPILWRRKLSLGKVKWLLLKVTQLGRSEARTLTQSC